MQNVGLSSVWHVAHRRAVIDIVFVDIWRGITSGGKSVDETFDIADVRFQFLVYTFKLLYQI